MTARWKRLVAWMSNKCFTHILAFMNGLFLTTSSVLRLWAIELFWRWVFQGVLRRVS